MSDSQDKANPYMHLPVQDLRAAYLDNLTQRKTVSVRTGVRTGRQANPMSSRDKERLSRMLEQVRRNTRSDSTLLPEEQDVEYGSAILRLLRSEEERTKIKCLKEERELLVEALMAKDPQFYLADLKNVYIKSRLEYESSDSDFIRNYSIVVMNAVVEKLRDFNVGEDEIKDIQQAPPDRNFLAEFLAAERATAKPGRGR